MDPQDAISINFLRIVTVFKPRQKLLNNRKTQQS